MKITITDTNNPSPEPLESGNPLIPKVKLIEALKTLAERPEENISTSEIKKILSPFLSNLSDKEIYEKTSGYVQILDEVVKQTRLKV